ncbi:hypothetical protein BJ875DRAFT_260305, partial [Amylocarpus encephaloides]
DYPHRFVLLQKSPHILSFSLFTLTSDFSFGPASREWHYSKTSKTSKTYDVSGEMSTRLQVRSTEGGKETMPPSHRHPRHRLLYSTSVDMQILFLDAQCVDHPNGLKAVDPPINVLEKCRAAGIKVQRIRPN